MKLALYVLGFSAVIELLMFTPRVWRYKRATSAALVVLVAVSSLGLLVVWPVAATCFLVYFSLYRIVNLLRVYRSRPQADYLFNISLRTSAWLIALQLFVLLLYLFGIRFNLGWLGWLYLIALLQLAAATVLFYSSLRHLRTTTPPTPESAVKEADLPSLTVAIPARNETDDLEECLDSLARSTYPKLEIVVLDDCSQNKRTSDIIRSYAQAGVRFIAGEVPPEQWLAKNYAYKKLAQEANGEIILFCGVDVRFEPYSLKRLVTTMLDKGKDMLSVMPLNELTDNSSLAPVLLQPSRYAWELALPRRFLQRPPVLSTCWLIKASALEDTGGFEAVSRKIIPESYFARYTASHSDSYSFLRSGRILGVTSHKAFNEQRATTIRTRYPQLHKRPELVGLTSLAQFTTLVWPIAALIIALATRNGLLAGISAIGYALVVAMHSNIVTATYGRFLRSSLGILPIAALYDLGMLNYSMYRYEFSEVLWKGRNVCIPVMRSFISNSAPQPKTQSPG